MILQVFNHNNKYFLLKLWKMVKNRKTYVIYYCGQKPEETDIAQMVRK